MKTATLHGFLVTQAENLTDEQRENNRKWVEALRSGKYKQISGCLHSGSGHCCLGVAAETLGASWDLDDSPNPMCIEGTEYYGVLPSDYAKQFGFGLGSGFRVRSEKGIQTEDEDGPELDPTLASLNDFAGLTFPQIADIIAFWAGLEQAGSPQDKERP